MADAFQNIIDRVLKGRKLFETFSEKTKKILNSNQITKREVCSFCKGAKQFLRSGHPMEPVYYTDCGHCGGEGIEREWEVLDIKSAEVLRALLNEPNGREWFLNGCVN